MQMSNKELRAKAREQLTGNWGKAVALWLIYLAVVSVAFIAVTAVDSQSGAKLIAMSIWNIALLIMVRLYLALPNSLLTLKGRKTQSSQTH